MILKVLFILRHGAQTPEALVVWDEYSIEENYEGFEKDTKKALDSIGSDMAAYRVIDIKVDERKVMQVLADTPTIEGKIV